MRFDDRFATVLARRPDRPSALIVQWRQLLDIVAQRQGYDGQLGAAVVATLNRIRGMIPIAVRREAAATIAGRPLDLQTVLLLANDVPVVAGALLGRVVLDEAGWIALLPRLTPTARGFLRHRRDLGARVGAALAGFGPTDFALAGTIADETPEPAPRPPEIADPCPEPAADHPEHPLPETPEDGPQPHEPGAGTGQIRAIISLIAGFRSGRDERAAPAPAEITEGAFRFETARDGLIRWVDGMPRGPLIGETIAEPATGRYGVDAQAPGAFRRRAPFRGARLTVAGDGPASGEWRIAGVPVFAPDDGRFLGYRGSARRPHAHERAGGDEQAPSMPPSGPRGDSMRQLVHELRTPINAIGGFAEMIRRQLRGPVSEGYRERAATIAADAGRLLATVDDIDLSARIDAGRLALQRTEIDVAALLRAVIETIGSDAAAAALVLDDHLPPVAGDVTAIHRMIARLATTLLSLADDGERIAITAGAHDGDVVIAFTRPARLRDLPADTLFDPGYDPAGDDGDAPLLGLGFSLHLVRRVARAAGGAIDVDEHAIRLRLPGTTSAFDIGRA